MTRKLRLMLVGTILIIFAVSIGISFFGFEYPRQAATLGKEGRAADGVIVRLTDDQTGKAKDFWADIQFRDVNNQIHKFDAHYPMNIWNTLSIGQHVPIRYLASDPSYALEPASYKAQRNPLILLLICSGLFIFGGVLFVLPWLIRR